MAIIKPPTAPVPADPPVKQVPGPKTISNKNIKSFPRAIANLHGVKEAVVVKYLAHKVRRSRKVHNEKKWHYDSLTDLATKLPYIPRSTMNEVLNRLEENGLIEIGNYNRMKIDRTQWFHVPMPYVDDVERDTIAFDSTVAAEHGIPAGVLYHNLVHWLTTKTKKKTSAEVLEHKMSPAALNRSLPFLSLPTIKRSLRTLVNEGLIRKVPAKEAMYTLPEDHDIMQFHRQKRQKSH